MAEQCQKESLGEAGRGGEGKERGWRAVPCPFPLFDMQITFPFQGAMKNLSILPGLGGSRLSQTHGITAPCSRPEIVPHRLSHTPASVPSNPHFKLSQHWDFFAAIGISNRLPGEMDARGERLNRLCTLREKKRRIQFSFAVSKTVSLDPD